MKIFNVIKQIPKPVKIIFKVIFTISLMVLIFKGFQAKVGNEENLLSALKENIHSTNPVLFLLAVSIYIICTILATYRIYLLTKVNNITLPFKTLLENYYIGLFFNAILMGATGGDFVRSWYLVKKTGRKAEVVTLVFLDRVIGMFVMLTIGIAAVIININDPELGKLLRPVLKVAIPLNIAIVTGALAASSRRVMKKLGFLKPLLKIIGAHNIAKKVHTTLNLTRKFKKAVLLTILTTVLVQFAAIVSCWVGAKSITGIQEIPFRYFMLFLPIIFTVQAIPVSLGGIGVGEAAFATLFLFVGIGESTSLTIAIFTRVILIIVAIIGGLVYLRAGHDTIPDDIT